MARNHCDRLAAQRSPHAAQRLNVLGRCRVAGAAFPPARGQPCPGLVSSQEPVDVKSSPREHGSVSDGGPVGAGPAAAVRGLCLMVQGRAADPRCLPCGTGSTAGMAILATGTLPAALRAGCREVGTELFGNKWRRVSRRQSEHCAIRTATLRLGCSHILGRMRSPWPPILQIKEFVFLPDIGKKRFV